MRKIYKILILIPLLYLVIIPVWFARSAYVKPCSGIVINISDSADYHFVTKRQLTSLVYGNSGKLLGKPVNEISTGEIEERIDKLRELRTAEVYITIDGVLNVYVDQRDPIMRIIPDEGGDFFMDREGFLFRQRNLYTPRLHIVQGNINITSAMLDSVSVLDTLIKSTILKDTYQFVNYINDDDFWSAQIDQINITGKNEVQLIPRVGNYVVHLGTYEDFRGKLKNLTAFYDQVLPEVGWNKYSLINLEFRDQVVCRRRQ